MGEVPPSDRKKILLVFAVLVFLIFFGLLLYRFRKQETEQKLRQGKKNELILLEEAKDPQYPAEMKISASTSKVTVGSSIEVSVLLNSGGKPIFGSDAIVKYDPLLLEVVEGSLKTSDLFKSYPRVESKGGGTISVSAYELGDRDQNKPNSFFRVTFKALSTGKARIGFDFEKGKTSGTTIVEKDTSQNILGKVNDVFVEIVEVSL